MSLFHDPQPMNHYRSSYTSHAAAKKTFERIHLCKSGYVIMKPGSVCERIHTNLDGYMSCQRMIHYCRPQCFVRSYGWCCSAGRLYSSFYAMSCEEMTNVYKDLQSEINPICGHWAAGQHVFNCVRDVEVLSLCQWKMYHTDLWGPVGNFILSCGVHCLFDSFWFNIIAIGKWYDNLMWSCTVSSVNRAITTTDGDKSPPIIIHCQIVHSIFDIDAALFVVNITKSFKSYTYKMIEFS